MPILEICKKKRKSLRKTNLNSKDDNKIKDINGFIVIGSNGSNLISSALLKLNLRKIDDSTDSEYYLKWTDVPSQIDWELFFEFKQIINHIPNSHLITNKGHLLQNLRQFDRLNKAMMASPSMIDMDSYFPETYYINNSKELQTFYENIERYTIWIYKPTDLNQGNGISLIRDKYSLDNILSKDLSSSNISRRPTGRIIQRYIINPLLIKNRKFDIRAYMLIANTAPFLVLYHSGYLRLSLEKYVSDSDKLQIHLTNQYIQKKDPTYEDVKEDTVWSMEQFSRHLNSNLESYPEINKNWVQNVFTPRMKSIMRQVFMCVKNKLSKQVGLFELFGFDFMIDSHFKVWLIEVNVNPSLDTNCVVLKQTLPTMMENTFDVVIECFEKCRQKTNILPLTTLSTFEIIYSDDSRWNWSQYFEITKLTVPVLKVQKPAIQTNVVKSRDGEQNESHKRKSQSKTMTLHTLQGTVSSNDSRKFPLSLTEKLYRESNFVNVQSDLKWIKT